MKTLTLALALLALLSCDQQPEASQKTDTTYQQNRNAGSSVVIAENNKKQPDSHAAPTGQHQGDTGTTARPAVSSQCVVDYLWERFKTLKAADKIALLLLIVTALYLLATFGIFLRMGRSNEQAKAAYEQSKEGADADRELMRKQLAEMATTSVDMGLLAKATQESAKAAAGSLEVTRLLERPWVRIELSAHTHLACEDGDLWVTPWLKLTNVGRSVATDIRYECKILPVLFGSVDATHTRFNDTAHRLPQTLLPGEDSGQVAPVSLTLDTVDQQYIRPEGDDNLLSVAITCTVTYKFPTSSETHTTHAIYHVGRYEQKRARITVKIGETLPSDLITFLKEPNGSYAD